MTRRFAALVGVAAPCLVTAAAAQTRQMGINVVLNTGITDTNLAVLGTHGRVLNTLPAINALTMRAAEGELDAIRALPFVVAVNPDAERNGSPVDTVAATDFANGRSTWDQDAINVTDFGAGRTIAYDGTGVYVAVVDTGLLDS